MKIKAQQGKKETINGRQINQVENQGTFIRNIIRLPVIDMAIYFMVIFINVISLDIKLLIAEGSKLREMKIIDIRSIRFIDLKALLSEIETSFIPC